MQVEAANRPSALAGWRRARPPTRIEREPAPSQNCYRDPLPAASPDRSPAHYCLLIDTLWHTMALLTIGAPVNYDEQEGM
jgi:hypothetical protein